MPALSRDKAKESPLNRLRHGVRKKPPIAAKTFNALMRQAEAGCYSQQFTAAEKAFAGPANNSADIIIRKFRQQGLRQRLPRTMRRDMRTTVTPAT